MLLCSDIRIILVNIKLAGHRTPLIFTIAVIFRKSNEEKVTNFYPLTSRVSRIIANDDPEIP
jgi:hypothetical protein